MQIPWMICPKEIKNETLGYSSLKVLLWRGVQTQPIKILLENKGDMTVESHFMAAASGPELVFSLPWEGRVSIEPG